jgi:hypothetical protein
MTAIVPQPIPWTRMLPYTLSGVGHFTGVLRGFLCVQMSVGNGGIILFPVSLS